MKENWQGEIEHLTVYGYHNHIATGTGKLWVFLPHRQHC